MSSPTSHHLPNASSPEVAPRWSFGDLKLIAESIPFLVFIAAADGVPEYTNRRGADYAGLPAGTPVGQGWTAQVHPTEADHARQAWEHAVRTARPYEAEYRLRNADGEYRWHAVNAQPVRDGNPSVTKWITTATEIEGQKRFEQHLRDTKRETLETLALLDAIQDAAPVGLGFVDCDFRILRINEPLARIGGATPSQLLGRTVAESVPDLWPQLEGLYRRVRDGGETITNVEISGETAEEPGRVHTWLTDFYPVRVTDRILGISVIALDITERRESERANSELMHAAVAAIAATVEVRDPYTAGHQQWVAKISSAITCAIGIDPWQTEGIALAASIHDIGKICVPAEILANPGKLRPAEWEIIKSHSRVGFEIVEGIQFPWPVAEMVCQHHERIDGSGYPDGLTGEEITFGARVIAVADTVEAMASHRPYRPSLGIEAALEFIEESKGALFEVAPVEACVDLFRSGRLGLRGVRSRRSAGSRSWPDVELTRADAAQPVPGKLGQPRGEGFR